MACAICMLLACASGHILQPYSLLHFINKTDQRASQVAIERDVAYVACDDESLKASLHQGRQHGNH